jgi:hypothetical protein
MIAGRAAVTDGKELPRHGKQDDCAGQDALQSGTYELCNIFGTPTGRRIVLACGEVPPQIPQGWAWRRLRPA